MVVILSSSIVSVHLWLLVEVSLLLCNQTGLRTDLFTNVDVQLIRLDKFKVQAIFKGRLKILHYIA